MPTKTKTIHRAALDGLTECGSCRNRLKNYCAQCKMEVIFQRRRTFHHFFNSEIEMFFCEHCGKPTVKYDHVGERLHRRADEERRKANREHRRKLEAEAREQRRADRERLEADDSEYDVPDGCAICGVERPAERRPDQGGQTGYNGAMYSGLTFLYWWYCPEHSEEGKQLDTTLKSMFRADASQVLEQVRRRVAPPLKVEQGVRQ